MTDPVAVRDKDDHLERRVAAIEAQLVANAKLTQEIHADMQLTREIHTWIGAGKGFFTVLGWIGSAVKWAAAVLAAVAAIWLVVFKGHEK